MRLKHRMKITKIKQQVKRPDRFAIFVDEKYSFSLSEQELMSVGIKIGQDLTESELVKLLSNADHDKAYLKALDYLSRRPRSKWEVEQYLLRKGHNDNTVSITLSRLSDIGYIDDLKFAESWVRSRRALKHVSKRKLIDELKQKHVSKVNISKVLDNDETDEQEVIRQIIQKKKQQTRYQDQVKLKAYLVRQGFSYDDINVVVNE